MNTIYETDNFTVEIPQRPHVDRDDGGHLIIRPKVPVRDRQHLSPDLAVELMRPTVALGEAMETVMNSRGVDIGRINYQDNGNWSVFKPEGPKLHVHLYGRAKSAKVQRYGQACHFPHRDEQPEYYAGFRTLTEDDGQAIQDFLTGLFRSERFSDQVWRL